MPALSNPKLSTPKLSTSKPPGSKGGHLHIRASQHQKTLLASAAKIRKMSVSQFVLQSALPLAEEVVGEENPEIATLFRLDAPQWEAFTQLLDAPPRPLPELKNLLLSKPVWDKPGREE